MALLLYLILFISLFAIVYHLILYPVLVIVAAAFSGNQSGRQSTLGGDTQAAVKKVTFVIAAYNEERVLREKLENTLSLDTKNIDLEIIVAADGSDDGTMEIAKEFAGQGVVLVYQPERRGKAAALNRAIENASGEYLVFSDANNLFNENAIQYLLRPLENEQVGAVCGAKKIIEDLTREASTGDSVYWKYESAIKLAESHLGGTTALDGEIFAMRKSDYVPIESGVINDDAEITFSLAEKNKSIVYEPDAESWEKASIDLEDDFNVKVRMIAGGYQTISRYTSEIFGKVDWFSFAFVSHKVLRWVMPFFLFLLTLSSVLLLGTWIGKFVVIGEVIAGLMAVAYRRVDLGAVFNKLSYLFYYFFLMNLAAFKGFQKSRKQQQSVNWSKAAR